MVDDLLSGRVTAFRREQGFGVITLDDGRDVKFDASNCTMVPEEGAAVRLRVGPAKWGGGFKALHVEPRGSSNLIVPPAPLSLDEQIAALQRAHLVGALSEHVMAQLVAELSEGGRGDAALIDVLDAYYAADAARARHDRYVRFSRSRSHAAGDVLGELAAVLPGAALPRVMAAGPSDAAPDAPTGRGDGEPGRQTDLQPADATGTLRVPTYAGEQTLEVRSIAGIVAAVNHGLEIAEDPRRLCPLTTGHDWCAYYVLDSERYKQLEKLLTFDPSPSPTATPS